MDDVEEISSAAPAPARVSLAPFSPATPRASRRLSSGFGEMIRPVPAARKPLAWVSLQGRLIGAQEATSAVTVGGGLSPEEALAWELFSPLHRVLIVAIVAVAARDAKRARMISKLQRSVDLRDQVLESMQQKLEDLCEQMNSAKGQSMNCTGKISCDTVDGILDWKGAEFCSCGCRVPELNPVSGIASLYGNPYIKAKDVDGSESGNSETFITNQHEERRMSDLSFCSSVASSVDIKLSSLAAEQDFYNLRKECEEKDATIKELTVVAHATRVADSKRIMELEEIIRRKNMVITKLKKDMVVLEQQVIQLTRMRRSSVASNMDNIQLPVMANNLLYDMSSTSASSSDSDSPSKYSECQSQGSIARDISQEQSLEEVSNQRKSTVEPQGSISKPTDRLPKQRSVSPSYIIRRADRFVALRPKRLVSSGGEFKRSKRHPQQESKCTASQRRWV